VPIYLSKNLHTPSPNDASQNEKDITRIKNDLADFLLAG
jgi:hypothetical protein